MSVPPRGPFPWQLVVLVAGIACLIVSLLITLTVITSGDWRDWLLGGLIAALVSRLP